MRFPTGSLAVKDVEICHNLRPSLRHDGLESVGLPDELPLDIPLPGGRLLPGGRIESPDGRRWIAFEHGGKLICHDGVSSVTLPDAPGRPSGIVRNGGRYLVMMGADAAPIWLSPDGEGRWSWQSTADMPVPLAIVRKDEAALAATVGGCGLRGAYTSRSTRLSEADRATLGRLVGDAYRSIAVSAVQRQVYFQPVIARYSLIARDGTTLYVSAPVMVTPPAGQQLLGVDFTLTGADFATLSEERMTASAFTLQLRPCAPLPEQWLETVGSVRLSVSPQLHPYDGTDCAPHRIGPFTATAGSLHVGLPGVNDSLSAQGGDGSSLRRLTEAILATADESLAVRATFAFDSVAGTWGEAGQPVGHPAPDPMAEIASLRRLAAGGGGRSGPDVALLNALTLPHRLCAGLAATCGDCVAYAGLSAMRFNGWMPCEFAVASVQGNPEGLPQSAPAAVKVTFADGSSCVRSGAAGPFAVSALSPLLTYPAADAVKLELFYERYSLRVSLRPDPSGRYAYWLADDGLPVGMTRDMPAFVLPSESPRRLPLPSAVAVASASDPLNPLAVIRTAEARPVALVSSPGSAGGWDSGSARFYLFGREGVQSLTVSQSRARLTARTLDTRSVDSADAVCRIGGSSLAALAGEDLVKISGQRVSTLRSFVGAARLAWHPVRGELVCFYSADRPCPENFTVAEGGVVRPLIPDATVHGRDGRMLYSLSCPQPSSLLADGPGLWAFDCDGRLYDLTSEQTGGSVTVAYRSSVTSSDLRPGRRWFSVPLSGEITGGILELRADNGAGIGHSDVMVACRPRGLIVHLPPLEVFTPHRHRFSLSVNLDVKKIEMR